MITYRRKFQYTVVVVGISLCKNHTSNIVFLSAANRERLTTYPVLGVSYPGCIQNCGKDINTTDEPLGWTPLVRQQKGLF